MKSHAKIGIYAMRFKPTTLFCPPSAKFGYCHSIYASRPKTASLNRLGGHYQCGSHHSKKQARAVAITAPTTRNV